MRLDRSDRPGPYSDYWANDPGYVRFVVTLGPMSGPLCFIDSFDVDELETKERDARRRLAARLREIRRDLRARVESRISVIAKKIEWWNVSDPFHALTPAERRDYDALNAVLRGEL